MFLYLYALSTYNTLLTNDLMIYIFCISKVTYFVSLKDIMLMRRILNCKINIFFDIYFHKQIHIEF